MQKERRLQAEKSWERARRKAMWAELRANLEGKKINLLDFNEVSQRLKLKNAAYRGMQIIPVDKIIGSVGRYNDFTSAFLPMSNTLRERWQRIAQLSLDLDRPHLPPIATFKVGDWYFVKDGNHRVSVAREIGAASIDSEVYEFTGSLLEQAPHAEIETLLIEAERQQFLEQTCLDELRPRHTIRLSAPGGYTEMLCQIDHYQEVLSEIDGEAMCYAEAVTAWYDMIYETSVQIIERANVLNMFPNRSAADFFVWCTNHHRELQERYGKPLLIVDAVNDLKLRHPVAWVRRVLYALRRRVRW